MLQAKVNRICVLDSHWWPTDNLGSRWCLPRHNSTPPPRKVTVIPMPIGTSTRFSAFANFTKKIAKRFCGCEMSLALLFALAPNLPAQAQHFQMVYEFPLAKTGNDPSALLSAGGNFYGTTANGGKGNVGTVFELSSTGVLTSLYSFNHNSTDGRNPTVGPLVRDKAGNLYGTTQKGGHQSCAWDAIHPGCGTVFKLSPTGQETILHSFTGAPGDGANPLAGLTMDAAGNIFGTTEYGGSSGGPCSSAGCGTMYKITPAGVETILYSFTGGADGGWPVNVSLVADSAGNLYGTAGAGGALTCGNGAGCGVVFKIDPTGKETVLYAFTGGASGVNPYAGLVRDSQGNLYGTTNWGGACEISSGCGVVFKVDPSGNETVLHAFSYTESGAGVNSSLVRDSAGNLYGTTFYGGSSTLTDGSVFEVSSQGVYTLLHAFDQKDGIWPQAGLLRDSAGKLYGATSQGGIDSCNLGCGVIFKITP